MDWYEIRIFSNRAEEQRRERSVNHKAVRIAPKPYSPDPASFETAVIFLTSFRFTRTPTRVSGPGQRRNKRRDTLMVLGGNSSRWQLDIDGLAGWHRSRTVA